MNTCPERLCRSSTVPPPPVRAAMLRRAAINTEPIGAVAPPIVHDVLRSPGQPLDERTRAEMGPRFEHDFADVRIHTDDRAAQSARSVNALAYTVGNHVAFDRGRYQPGTSDGQRLLAHELAHVVQQHNELPARNNVNVGAHDSILEHQASLTSALVQAGGVAQGLERASRPDLQRQQSDLAGLHLPEPTGSQGIQGVNSATEGEYWILPPNVPSNVEPVYDDVETQTVVGFRTRGSVTIVFDLTGRVVEMSEPGLESPLIDPIDILAGGLSGVFRGGFRAILGSGAKSAAGASASAGVRAGIRLVSQRAATALRAAYRALRFRGSLNFSATAAAHLDEVGRRVPQHLLKLAIQYGRRTPDPQGVPGVFRYLIPLYRGTRDSSGRWVYREYSLEVVLREADQTVLHFLYR